MPRHVGLSSRLWKDRDLDVWIQKAAEWGYQTIELSCQGEHLAVQKALSEQEANDSQRILGLLEKHELRLVSLCNPILGEVIGSNAGQQQQTDLPDYIWGEGDPQRVRERATEELIATARVAQSLGVQFVVTHSGSPFSSSNTCSQPLTREQQEAIWQDWASRWVTVLNAYQNLNIRLAFEIAPGQAAFDYFSTEAALKALGHHPTVGLALNPGHLHWQGVDPVEWSLTFAEHLLIVYLHDVAIHLNGRSGLLCGHYPMGDARRGWSVRAPGHGGVDWMALNRVLYRVGFDGPMLVKAEDADMDRDFVAQETVSFVRRIDFEPLNHAYVHSFRDE